ncbi:uncharacterized protein LY89DRAFT_726634 [Mollisia scopiformis]|uniref:Zn(2)-C6 fungal-type domain-containing protein n=1 Tax=Mollisia scopiformis TaxID=149040 RepID=A0A132B1R7_MOLSC|nr:uncharacterized protein LY89DRAFT_726634 [Mollisia scopiformis]KUJ06325.1 hypothetical protein LY89DRAFT_726634 [Mollisia scopiformis]
MKGQKNVAPRQRPVSCHFCRARKLRCNRMAPCSNCISRRINCTLESPVVHPSNTPSTPSISETSEIIERLNRLENLLATQKIDVHGQSGQPPEVEGSRPPLVHAATSPPQAQTLDVDSEVSWLESAFLDQIPSVHVSKSQVVFRTCPVGQITSAKSYIYPRELGTIGSSELSRCIWLPPVTEARVLLDKFIRVAHHLPYVTHISSLPSVLEQIYADLNQQRQIQLGQVVWLLSIVAAATHSWLESDCVYGLFTTSAGANDQASLWIKATEDVLDMACQSPKVSIEGVQGAIILGFVAAHVDGLHRYRVLFAIAVVLARDLGLHRIDHPSNASMANTARAEIGRRVWWYLCASEWKMAARVGGMAEGIYSCHPRQMITKKPLNINDDEVFDGMSRDERPLSQPTAMSYTMQRIRLAEISRSIVERSPLAMAHTDGLSHDAVMDIDTELQTLINDVPEFYSMSKSALMQTYRLTQSQAEKVVFQGLTTYFLLYTQRCKLHFPFFAHSFENPAYYPSRDICIKYAHLIIQSKLWLENSDIDCATGFKFAGLLIGVFLACIVLLMDICTNPLSPQNEQQREEVYKSFQIIQEAQNESQTTAKIVGSLVHILQKYNQQPLDSTHQQPRAPAQTDMALDVSQAPGYSECGAIVPPMSSYIGVTDSLNIAEDGPPNEGGDDLSSYWNNFTQSFEQGIDVNSFDWDNIFLELDSSFI